ncbi:MAG TPA: glycoside hydrolase family 68 protein [Novosphingobium sp.]|nr:glycoside hydrolase family 68 protein [Novosphingobium sp.]
MQPDSAPSDSTFTLEWASRDVALLAGRNFSRAPVIAAADVRRVGADLDVWDAWPLADDRGAPLAWRGGELWFALAAPALDDPERRHGLARIHQFHRLDGDFIHLGRTFPEGFTPGSREWSGSAHHADGVVTLCFTAAGARGEPVPTFQQRLFATTARFAAEGGGAVFDDWSEPVELAVPADVIYMSRHDGAGQVGEIKAFRDPATWRTDDGGEYLLFTASSAQHLERYNGVIGCARRRADGSFEKLPPLVDASGLNNELERPHIVAHRGLLYLFWSTQARVFAPGIAAPTGLYGAVAERIEGPWWPLNGHGLVFANPASEPFQAYSWWVLPDLSVASFVDYWGIDDTDAPGKPAGRTHFGGTFAPFLQLRLDGHGATLKDG